MADSTSFLVVQSHIAPASAQASQWHNKKAKFHTSIEFHVSADSQSTPSFQTTLTPILKNFIRELRMSKTGMSNDVVAADMTFQSNQGAGAPSTAETSTTLLGSNNNGAGGAGADTPSGASVITPIGSLTNLFGLVSSTSSPGSATTPFISTTRGSAISHGPSTTTTRYSAAKPATNHSTESSITGFNGGGEAISSAATSNGAGVLQKNYLQGRVLLQVAVIAIAILVVILVLYQTVKTFEAYKIATEHVSDVFAV
jgi:hypothetical protein